MRANECSDNLAAVVQRPYYMGEQQVLVELEQRPAKPRQAVPVDQLQLRQPNRDQFTYAAIDVERLVPADHLVRAIWELSGMLDLSGFAAHLETRKESADPRLLVAIWIWAYSERMSSGGRHGIRGCWSRSGSGRIRKG